jgi:uncharacterized protein YegP (UPF0339 family)
MAGKFEIAKTDSGKFLFRLKAGNGQVILASQLYDTKDGAVGGANSVKNHGTEDANFERKTSKSGQAYFNLKASNGQIIGKSEMYASTTAMENGITSVKTNAPDAPIEDKATA